MQMNRQQVKASAAVSAVNSSLVAIPCLYTKQKTKKRKTFIDGIIKVNEFNGQCLLYSASDIFISAKEGHLESQFISPSEAKKVLQGLLRNIKSKHSHRSHEESSVE
jgi:hypothetical protein